MGIEPSVLQTTTYVRSTLHALPAIIRLTFPERALHTLP